MRTYNGRRVMNARAGLFPSEGVQVSLNYMSQLYTVVGSSTPAVPSKISGASTFTMRSSGGAGYILYGGGNSGGECVVCKINVAASDTVTIRVGDGSTGVFGSTRQSRISVNAKNAIAAAGVSATDDTGAIGGTGGPVDPVFTVLARNPGGPGGDALGAKAGGGGGGGGAATSQPGGAGGDASAIADGTAGAGGDATAGAGGAGGLVGNTPGGGCGGLRTDRGGHGTVLWEWYETS